MPLIRRIPKRGFNNARHTTRYIPVNLESLNRFDDGARVDVEALKKAGLANGNWGWFVNAANAYGTSAWSDSGQFTVAVGTPTPTPTPAPSPANAPPSPPTLATPTGGVTVTTPSPVFTWYASAGTTSYQLLVQNLNGVGVNMAVSPAAAGCSAKWLPVE